MVETLLCIVILAMMGLSSSAFVPGRSTASARTNIMAATSMETTTTDTDWQSILDGIAADIQPYLDQGQVATYIPALASVDPNQFGMAFTDVHTGQTYAAGSSAYTPFSIQSISKVFALVVALDLQGDALLERVGREPSGSAFNSIVQLESEQGRPRNPFINAGAIAVTNTIQQHFANQRQEQQEESKWMQLFQERNDEDGKWEDDDIHDGEETSATSLGPTAAIDRILSLLRECAQCQDDPETYHIRIDQEVASSESIYGDRNRALAYFMRSYGIVQGDVYETLSTYFQQCALEMNVVTLSRAGLFLAAAGKNPLNGDDQQPITSHDHVNRVNSLMMLCGHYDMSGDFAWRVGISGKSGVGGGILAVIPDVGTVAVWSPRLNKAGNSLAGTQALEWFSKRAGVNIF